MSDLSTLVTESINRPQQHEPSAAVRQLFMLMHGSYGNLFLSKFSTGEKDATGKDKGIKSAMLVWDNSFREFTPEIVQTAAKRAIVDFPDFPPSMPQFLALCRALTPRKTYAEEHGFTALPPPVAKPMAVDYTRKNDGKDWARKILARHAAGEKIIPYSLNCAKAALMTPGQRAGLTAEAA